MIVNNLKKIDISKSINKKTGLPISFSKKIVDDLVEISVELIRDNTLSLKNIGTLKKVFKKEREGRNPMTGEIFSIKKRISVSFTPSKNLTNSLNKF